MTTKNLTRKSVITILILSLLISLMPMQFSYAVKSEVNEPTFTKSFASSKTFQDENVRCTIKKNVMYLTVKTLLPTYEFRLNLYGVYPPKGVVPLDIIIPADISEQSSNGKQIYKFNYKLDLKKYEVAEGDYYLYISRRSSENDAFEKTPSYGALYKNMPFNLTDGDVNILRYDDVINENKSVQAIGDDYDPAWYLDNTLDDIRFVLRNPSTNVYATMTSYKSDFIKSISSQITSGVNNDYEKLLKIYEYVTGNFYYDSVAFSTHSYQYADPYDNLYNYVNKIASANSDSQGRVATTCQGFSALVISLARAEGIPSRLVYGHRLTPPFSNWGTENNISVRDHWWVEAYINGRWFFIDPTVGTNNRWNKNKNEWKYFGITNYTYFDPSIEQISVSHIYHNIFPDKRFGYLISNQGEIDKFTSFLEYEVDGIKNGTKMDPHYSLYEKKSWGDGKKSHFMTDGYGNTTQVQWSEQDLRGTFDLSGFNKLKLVSSHSNLYDSVNLSNCTSLEKAYLRYNPLKEVNLYANYKNVKINAEENGTFSFSYDKRNRKSLKLFYKPDIGYGVKGIYDSFGKNLATFNYSYSFKPQDSNYTIKFGLNPESYRYYLYSYNNTDKTKPYNAAVQKRLVQLGYFTSTPDGYYEEMTEDAIETFQAVNNQPVTGKVGKNTWRALFNENAISKPSDLVIDEINKVNEAKLYLEGIAENNKITLKWNSASLVNPDEDYYPNTIPTSPTTLDGYEIWKYSYDKSKYYLLSTTSNTTYTDTSKINNGVNYQYKVRGYKLIDGHRYYSQWTKTIVQGISNKTSETDNIDDTTTVNKH